MRTFLFRLIGMLQVAGGFYGAAAMLRRLFPLGDSRDGILVLIGLALFVFTLVAGIMLLAGNARGEPLSRWAQLLQIPLIATPVFSYAFHCGADFNVFTTLQASPHPGMAWQLGSQGYAMAIAGPGVSRIGINLVALLAWLALRL